MLRIGSKEKRSGNRALEMQYKNNSKGEETATLCNSSFSYESLVLVPPIRPSIHPSIHQELNYDAAENLGDPVAEPLGQLPR